MAKYYIPTWYKKVEKKVMRSQSSENDWIEMYYGNVESFVGLIRPYFDKFVPPLRTTALVGYYFHVAVFIISGRRRRWLLGNR